MVITEIKKEFNIKEYLECFTYTETNDLALFIKPSVTRIEYIDIEGKKYPKFINEYWTAKQRQASSIHEISYRACFKAQLPRFFIQRLTQTGETVYDPFNGRGTTIIEAALLGRNIIANDINPLSIILSKPRLFLPSLRDVQSRLEQIEFDYNLNSDIDLSMFYHPKTESEIVSIKNYLQNKKEKNVEDEIDRWIRMVATNRLTGHSTNFFSVYTFPPNQAITAEKQKKINQQRKQIPEYKETKKIIMKKTSDLIKKISVDEKNLLILIGKKSLFLNKDARFTYEISDESVKLTVTSPPFLDIVQYADDNWLRCWFNGINVNEISKKITMSKNVQDWCDVMYSVFHQLYRITKKNGWVAFEVGEVRKGKIKLDEFVIPLGVNTGFICEGVLINEQNFTKTANIWGIENNTKGTNTNRIILFRKK